MVNSMKIKCYVTLEETGDPPKEEIRLMKVDPESETVYDDLLAKLIDCYRGENCVFVLQWKDEEGDDIVVSSNSEMEAAIEESQNSTLKMKISLRNAAPATAGAVWGGYANTPRPSRPKLVPNWKNVNMCHPGVTCDGCEGPVMGPRWKCSACEDFDLCKPCKKKGVHSDHPFIKIPFRLRNTRKGLWCTGGPFFPPGVHVLGRISRNIRQFGPGQSAHDELFRAGVNNIPGLTGDDLKMIGVQQAVNEQLQAERASKETLITEDPAVEEQTLLKEPVPAEESASPIADDPQMPSPDPNVDLIDMDVSGVREERPDSRSSTSSDGEFVLLETSQPEPAKQHGEEVMDMENLSLTDSLYSDAGIPAQPAVPTQPATQPALAAPTAQPTAPAYTQYNLPAEPTPVFPPVITSLSLPAHVYSSLACMLDMGYTNSGEWLAKLLLNKNGDINIVIDILNARNSRKDK